MILKERLRAIAILTAVVAITLVLFEGSYSTEMEIPDGARVVADAYVDEWCRAAQINPHFYGVVGKQIDRRDLVLEEGYVDYYVYEADAIRFAESSDVDPTHFASAVEYEFPMYLSGELVATLHVLPNRDPSGGLIIPERGEYRVAGFRYPDNALDDMIVSLTHPKETRARVFFSVVEFTGNPGEMYIMVDGGAPSAKVIPVSPAAMSVLEVTISVAVEGHEAVAKIKRRILREEYE